MVTCSNQQQPLNPNYAARQPQFTSAADIEEINVQLRNSGRYNKTETMTCSKQLTHRKCKGEKNGDTCAADIKQISICLQKAKQETNNQKTNRWDSDLFKGSSLFIEIMQTKRH